MRDFPLPPGTLLRKIFEKEDLGLDLGTDSGPDSGGIGQCPVGAMAEWLALFHDTGSVWVGVPPGFRVCEWDGVSGRARWWEVGFPAPLKDENGEGLRGDV